MRMSIGLILSLMDEKVWGNGGGGGRGGGRSGERRRGILLGAHLESQSRWKLLKVCCLSGRNVGPYVTCFLLKSQEAHTNQGKEIKCLSLKSHFICAKSELQAGRLQRGLLVCACVRIYLHSFTSPDVLAGFLCVRVISPLLGSSRHLLRPVLVDCLDSVPL